jgi:transposase
MSKATTRNYHRIAEDKRIQIVALRSKGLTLATIAAQTKVKIITVRSVLSKWKLHHTVQDLPKTGRPHKVDDRTKRRLARMVQKGEIRTATELAQTATSHEIVHISARTARRTLHEQGLKAMRMINKPLLTRAHKRKRLEFARAHMDWTSEEWKQVIFSDETVITARQSDSHKLKWVKPTHSLNPKLIVPTVQGGGFAIMTWGCISKFGFHDFILLDGTMDAVGYVNVLENYLIPVIREYFQRRPCIFQQDGASVHTAHVVKEFFANQNFTVLEWPPHSPDLNIIEHVWHYLKEIVWSRPVANSKQELWDNVQVSLERMWSQEMTTKINKLYESMPSRIQAVIDTHGGNTKY